MPEMCETVTSNNFLCSPGGKGSNPIAASSRLGSKCSLVSKVGDDLFGHNFLDILRADNINSKFVTFAQKASTSVASIFVDSNGEKRKSEIV